MKLPLTTAFRRSLPPRGSHELRQKLSLPLGGKVPSESEANEGRDMLFSSGFLAVILGFPFGEAVNGVD